MSRIFNPGCRHASLRPHLCIRVRVYGVNYYDGVKLLADAMVKAGTTTDKPKLIAQLAKSNYAGVAGTYSFDTNGDLKGAPTTVYVIRNGLPQPYAK